MTATYIGYARCSTDKQDLTAQRRALLELGVDESRIYLDHGLTGIKRDRPASTRHWRPSALATRSSCPSSTGSPAPYRTLDRSATRSPPAASHSQ